MKKLVLAIMMITLLSVLEFSANVQPVKASRIIYIKGDGSIDPPTAPLVTVDNVTYMLTGNVTSDTSGIVVQRDNVVLDGAGYTLQGPGSGNGFYSSMNNVTLRNMHIKSFLSGIYLVSASNSSISGNTITNNTRGVRFDSTSNSSISGNTITANKGYAIWLRFSSESIIQENYITNNWDGIWLDSSSNNSKLIRNNITSNGYGIRFDFSSNNILRDNAMADNSRNFVLGGWEMSDFVNDVDTSNTVDGKPVCYWVGRHSAVVPLEVGYVALVNCTNIRAENLTLTKNGQGILLAYTDNSAIMRNNVTSNGDGIWLYYSSNNDIQGNNVTSNWNGIRVDRSSNNTMRENSVEVNSFIGIVVQSSAGNVVYHNNIIGNLNQLFSFNSSNTYDNGCEGNYWNNYNGIDLDNDGVGDTDLPWRGVDSYPLMSFYWNPGDIDHDLDVDIFDVVCAAGAYDSTPSDLHWNPHCDLDSDRDVDIFDIVTIASAYGETFGDL